MKPSWPIVWLVWIVVLAALLIFLRPSETLSESDEIVQEAAEMKMGSQILLTISITSFVAAVGFLVYDAILFRQNRAMFAEALADDENDDEDGDDNEDNVETAGPEEAEKFVQAAI